jgi:hypothetical protein
VLSDGGLLDPLPLERLSRLTRRSPFAAVEEEEPVGGGGGMVSLGGARCVAFAGGSCDGTGPLQNREIWKECHHISRCGGTIDYRSRDRRNFGEPRDDIGAI